MNIFFRKKLITWFRKNKRPLPWRLNPSWYKTYLSEIILQQTTVDQGLPYFTKFLSAYPNIQSLAAADEQNILNLWAGLGYYSRARNMHKAAKKIILEYAGEFPQDYKSALKIPGIGPYSTSAILSIAFNEPVAVADGNVIRVLARVFALQDDTRQKSTIKKITEYAGLLLDKIRPGLFNESLMELGALVCKPQKPLCKNCPINEYCHAYNKDLVKTIPYKSSPAPKHKKYNFVFILTNNSKFCLVRRPSKGLLASMWELPVLEVEAASFDNPPDNLFMEYYKAKGKIKSVSQHFRHIYSHIDLRYKAFVIHVSSRQIEQRLYTDTAWVHTEELTNYAIHNAHKKVIEWFIRLNNQNQETGKK